MVDETLSGGGSAASICPWCSATYTGARETCPSCHAALAADPAADASMPGLTAVDTEAIVRAKMPVARPRNRLLSWISGEYPDQAGVAAEAGALAPPDAAVRREMLRLELEAQVANAQAEVESMVADAAVEDGRSLAPSEDEAADETASGAADSATGDLAEPAAAEPARDAAAGRPDDEAPPA
jgi:hypothetical protein